MTFLHAVVCSVGVVANTLAYVSLRRIPPSTPDRTLLRHQCFLDAALCVAGFVLLAQPHMWQSGLPALDAILCRFWHSEFLFFSHSNMSMSILLLCVLEHLTFVPMAESDPDRRTKSWYVFTVYTVGYFNATPELATVTFEDGKCFNRMSLLPGMDGLLCAAAVTMLLVPLVFVCVFLRRQCVVQSFVSHILNREQSRELTIYVFAVQIAVLLATVGVTILTYIISMRRLILSTYSDKEVMLAIILSRSVFSTPGLLVSKAISAETDSSTKSLLGVTTCSGIVVYDRLSSKE